MCVCVLRGGGVNSEIVDAMMLNSSKEWGGGGGGRGYQKVKYLQIEKKLLEPFYCRVLNQKRF